MHSTTIILKTASRMLFPLLLIFSLFVLIRGHNFPGGGFVGGLVAAAAFALHALSYSRAAAIRALRLPPHIIAAIGLLFAVVSGLVGAFRHLPFFAGVWAQTVLPVIGKIGTPLLFDIGVYFLVLGITLTILFSAAEEDADA